MLHHFIDELYLFDISLHPLFHVVFGTGASRYLKSFGLSARFNLRDAIELTLEEMLQSFGNSYNKRDIRTYDDQETEYEDVYMNENANLNPAQFMNSFSFMLTSNLEVVDVKEIEKNNISLNENICQIEHDLGIKVYCTFIPTFTNTIRTKIVKVISPEGYPHMYPPAFDGQTNTFHFHKWI